MVDRIDFEAFVTALITLSSSFSSNGMGLSNSWSRNPSVSPRATVMSIGDGLSTTIAQVLYPERETHCGDPVSWLWRGAAIVTTA